MIYLFGGVGSGGNGWLHWRPLLIAGLMLIGFAMQQGVGRRRWEALRQHFEQLVGVQMQGIGPGQARQGQGQVEGQGGQAQAAQGADAQPGRQGQQGEVTVEQVAGNLVRQQQERGRGWLRERLRGVERAVALFMVSLWPGMGEGIVRAREQAEIRRIAQAEADERARAEETRRLEEEQQQGQPTEGVVAEAAGPGEGASTGAQVQEQAEQQDGEMRRVNKGKEKVEGEPSASTEAETSAPQERLLDLG